jgi:hypothetical protein
VSEVYVTRSGLARAVAAGVALALLAGCGGGDGDTGDGGRGSASTTTPARRLTAPTFDADPSATSSTTSTAPPGSAPTTPTSEGESTEKVEFDDPVGDATTGVGTGTPGWTDLAGGSLERQGNAYRLIVRLGGAPPARSDGKTTMNIASYYDVDGDGSVDFEIWANLGPNGWAPVWYDDEGHAAAGDRSNVTIKVTGSEVRLLFPDALIDSPAGLRFSLASEYGTLAALGSDAARRDDAPDGDRAVSFP